MAPQPPQTTSLGTFNYGSLQTMLVYYSVPASVVKPFLKGTGLEPGIFDGKALVNLNFERYAGFGKNYSSFVDEVEFNIVVYSKDKRGIAPALSVQDFLGGNDQTRSYGNYRVNVPCDSAVAVEAGKTKYGEIKFVASFDFIVPDVNDPTVTTWWIRCYASTTAPKSQLPYIFDLKVNTSAPGMPVEVPSPFSPIPDYATLVVKRVKHMVTSARVIFGLFRSWIAPTGTTLPAGAAQLVIGDAKHVMTREMKKIFASNPPAVGVLLFDSPPAASSAHTLVTKPIR